MGGGSSRFEETDWKHATGKLTSSEETIDGAPPTPQYKVYEIFKTAGVINQREYDVTDEESNLLYSTRGIEGRLAWFDVLGPGMEQFLLRVQVDLSRRHWVIYRYGVPSYPGQFADAAATSFLRQTRGETQPCLYKKACITVTWSRYHAIVNFYGPPPDEYQQNGNQNTMELNQDTSNTPSWAIVDPEFLASKSPIHREKDRDQAQSKTVATVGPTDSDTSEMEATELAEEKKEDSHESIDPVIKSQPNSGNELPEEKVTTNEASKDGFETDVVRSEIPGDVPSEKDNSKSLDQESNTDDLDDGNGKSSCLGACDTSNIPFLDFTRHVEEIPDCLKNPNLGPTEYRSKSHQQLKKLTKWVKDNTAELPSDPLEGYLVLDKVILKCEEINSFLGQHQTMLVGEKEAKQLKRQELKAAAESGSDAYNPNANYNKDSMSAEEATTSTRPLKEHAVKSESEKSFPRMRKLGKWLKKVGEAGSEWATSTTCSREEASLDPKTEIDQRKASSSATENPPIPPVDYGGNLRRVSSSASLDGASVVSSTSKSEDLEPLVGFWNWDNTMRVHKMKMHVAEGSDLALHVVLAIVTNQLRYERNVVVTTV